MARRCDSLPLNLQPDLAFDQVRAAARKQGWIVTKELSPPGRWYRPPELRLKAGPARVAGAGRLRLQFRSDGAGRTCVSITTRWAANDSRAEASVRSLAEALGLSPEALHLDQHPDKEQIPGWLERSAVRALVGGVAALAILSFILVKPPSTLPATALNQKTIYHLEVALLVFYGGLLLLTPAFWGVIRGRLPTEISSRGAKYAEDVGQAAEIAEKRIDGQLKATEKLASDFLQARVDIDRLAERANVELEKPG
jgi:hypothetical protein